MRISTEAAARFILPPKYTAHWTNFTSWIIIIMVEVVVFFTVVPVNEVSRVTTPRGILLNLVEVD